MLMIKFLTQLFTRSKLNVVEKDEVISESGWRLRFLGNSPGTWRVEYTEGEKVVTTIVEPPGAFWYVDLSDASWDTSSGQIEITDTDKKRIRENIQQGMRALKHACKVKF